VSSYKDLKIESFCDYLITEKEKHVQLGVVSTASTPNKSFVAQQKYKSKNPKKQHPHHNNKKNEGPKHCNIYGKDGHVESNVLK
jgi:hypothetical protein